MEKGKGRNDSAPIPGPSLSRPVFDENRSPSSNTFFDLSCLIEGDCSVFDVTVSKSSKITALKKLVYNERKNALLCNIDAADLVLLKVNIDLETSDGDDLTKLSFTPDDEGVHKLKEWKLVSDYWSKQPENGRVHIFVKALATARKHMLEDPSLGGFTKRQKMEASSTSTIYIIPNSFPSAADLRTLTELHACIKDISDDPKVYSDPSRVLELPFPSINQVPPRFVVSENGKVSYMGREAFAKVWDKWRAIEPNTRQRQAIYVYGSRGYGKSHILAALACLLVRLCKQVVYIPDCRAMFHAPFEYLQAAFLFAFADSGYLTYQKLVLQCETVDALVSFSQQYKRVGRLCFIVDQLNALDLEARGEDEVPDETKSNFRQLLLRMSAGHVAINSASANHKTAQHMAAKDTGDEKIALLGGQTDTEMAQWWLRHHECFLNFSEDDKRRIEDLTGCIPLFLAPFLKLPGGTLEMLEPRIWDEEPLASITDNTTDFALKQQRILTHQIFHHEYVPLMRACLMHANIVGTGGLMDHRYFYIDSQDFGNYTCGLARQAMVQFLRMHGEEQIFLGPEWLQSLEAFKHNPSVIGFITEQIIISKIASTGIQSVDLPPAAIMAFGGSNTTLSPDKPSTFYVPLKFNFKAVDLVYAEVNQKKRTANVMGIQITVAKKHADSEAAFFAEWNQWTVALSKFQITPSFLWIVEGKRGQKEVKAKITALRNRPITWWPTHQIYYASIEQVDVDLAHKLASIHRDRVQSGEMGDVDRNSGKGDEVDKGEEESDELGHDNGEGAKEEGYRDDGTLEGGRDNVRCTRSKKAKPKATAKSDDGQSSTKLPKDEPSNKPGGKKSRSTKAGSSKRKHQALV